MNPLARATELTRARHGAAAVANLDAPYDRLLYRVFHPAVFSGTPQERQTGQLPADTSSAPWPVVVLLNGINVGPEGYRWLAERLARAGIATVTFNHVVEVTPGQRGLSPGLDLDALQVGVAGTRPSSTTIGSLLDALAAEHREGPLAGLLDLDRVVLGGHSAGGTMALLNAEPAWFPGVRATFSYAGHTMPAALLGHPEGTVLPVAAETPALILGGTDDGVVAASAVRYGTGPAPADRASHDPVTATFERGVTAAGSALVVLEGAGHLTFCDPVDPTTARGFLEPDHRGDGAAHRALIGSIVTAFCAQHLERPRPGPTVTQLADGPLVARSESKAPLHAR